jgi:hypothetical protein
VWISIPNFHQSEVEMNLQREAYLMEYQRQQMTNELNNKIKLPQPTSRLDSKISNGLRLIGQIRGIRVHVTFDWKEPAEQVRANA